jgi:ligand-binding sensor domain-containing protein
MRVLGNTESLGNNDVHGICNTKAGEMFLATFGDGLNKVIEYDPEGFPVKFHSYTTNDGLPVNVCLAVLEDENGKLWISMENNLTKFDPEKEEFETFAEIKRLMSAHNFSEASTCKLSNNNLVFGFSKGLLHFTPQEITKNNFKPYIALSGFRLFNQTVPVGKKIPRCK